jgi:hypothetical protein
VAVRPADLEANWPVGRANEMYKWLFWDNIVQTATVYNTIRYVRKTADGCVLSDEAIRPQPAEYQIRPAVD